jgi:hypothetical protein
MINNFINTLITDSGHQKHKEKLKPYEFLIGSWNFDWVGHNEDGSTLTVPGEWHFSWILQGRAIQDSWICPKIILRSSGKYPEGEYSTTIRFYDFNDDSIKVIWIGPILSRLNIFEVTQTENQIMQEEILVKDKSEVSKWQFKDFNESSFKWEAYLFNEKQKTWNLKQEIFAKI